MHTLDTAQAAYHSPGRRGMQGRNIPWVSVAAKHVLLRESIPRQLTDISS